MTDLHRHAQRIKDSGYSVQEFAESLAGQMNIHDRSDQRQWIEVARITADYALMIYIKTPETIAAKIHERDIDIDDGC